MLKLKSSSAVVGLVIAGAGFLVSHPVFASTTSVTTQAVQPPQYQTTTTTGTPTLIPGQKAPGCGKTGKVLYKSGAKTTTTSQKFNVVDVTKTTTQHLVTPAPYTQTFNAMQSYQYQVQQLHSATYTVTPPPTQKLVTTTSPGPRIPQYRNVTHSTPILKWESYQVPTYKWESYQVPNYKWEPYSVPTYGIRTFKFWGWISTGGSHWGVVGHKRVLGTCDIYFWDCHPYQRPGLGQLSPFASVRWVTVPVYGWISNGHYGTIVRQQRVQTGTTTKWHQVRVGSTTKWHQVQVGSTTKWHQVQVGTHTWTSRVLTGYTQGPPVVSSHWITYQPPSYQRTRTWITTSTQTGYHTVQETRTVHPASYEATQTHTSSQVIGTEWKTIHTHTDQQGGTITKTIDGLCVYPT